TILAGQTATFRVTASGTAPSYQWRRNGSNIPGATSSSYTTPSMSIAGTGVKYSVEVSNSAGSLTSTEVSLTVSTFTAFSQVANGSGGVYAKTDCVIDNKTGFVWEGKPTSGERAANLTYTNYDDTSKLQKQSDPSSPPLIYSYPTQAEIDGIRNTMGYVNFVNQIALCGFTDWRLPTLNELTGIVVTSQASQPTIIDSDWFPNTQLNLYWTSTPLTLANHFVYFVNFGLAVAAGNSAKRGEERSVRLVRGGQ
ncbi:MAG: DUF1566 domain-containing protein, partial [Rhodoferax sp.]|nr:DUF1566 domain-containing protein [Rhodoferax sp.]